MALGAPAQPPQPFSVFADRVFPEDRPALHDFWAARLVPGAPLPPSRVLCRLRWDMDSDDFFLVSVEAIAGETAGRFIKLETGLMLASDVFEQADMSAVTPWSFDRRSGRLRVQASWKARLGYGPDELEPLTFAHWQQAALPEDLAQYLSDAVQAQLTRGEVVRLRSRCRHRDGHLVSILSMYRAVRWDRFGKVTNLVGCDLDISAFHALEVELEHERDRLTQVLDALPLGKIVLDDGGQIIYANPVACALVGYGADAAIGQSLVALLRLEAGQEEVLAAIEDPSGVIEVPFQRRQSGRRQMLQLGFAAMPGPSPARRVLVSINDVTALQELQVQLRQSIDHARFIATHDLMTGLPDRYHMLRLLGEHLAQARAESDSLAVLSVHFDNLGLIVDTLGHDTAHQLVKSAAKLLEQGLPEGAIVARTGASEFVVLLPGAGRLDAEAHGWEIVRAFARPVRLMRGQCFLTVSVGVAVAAVGRSRAEEMLRKATMAMNRSKWRGGNTVTLFTHEMGAQFERHNAVAQAVYRALEEGLFELYLQPKFEVAAGTARVVGAEALLRLNDAELGPVSPAEFVPVAEAWGLAAAIDIEVMRLAGALVTGWVARGIAMPIAINLNAATLDEPGHADLPERLMRVGLLPERVTLEMTETGLAAAGAQRQRNLRRLRDAGYKISIDDFGTGQSALGALHSLPVTELKVDRSFVAALDGEDPGRALAILRAILAMAHALGLRTIAEGVETQSQLAQLLQEGCTCVQGYLLGRPCDLRSFEARFLGPGLASSLAPSLTESVPLAALTTGPAAVPEGVGTSETHLEGRI